LLIQILRSFLDVFEHHDRIAGLMSPISTFCVQAAGWSACLPCCGLYSRMEQMQESGLAELLFWVTSVESYQPPNSQRSSLFVLFIVYHQELNLDREDSTKDPTEHPASLLITQRHHPRCRDHGLSQARTRSPSLIDPLPMPIPGSDPAIKLSTSRSCCKYTMTILSS